MGHQDSQFGARARAADIVARRLNRPSVPSAAFALLGMLTDALAIALAIWFATYAQSDAAFLGGPTMLSALAVAGVTVGLLWAMSRYELDALRRVLLGLTWALVIALGATLLAGTLGAWPMTLRHGLSWFGLLALSLGISRSISGAIAHWAMDFGLTDRNAVLVGGGAKAGEVIEAIAASPEGGVNIVGLFDDRFDDRSPDTVLGVPKLGMISDLIPFARQAHIDMVTIAFPVSAEARIREVTALLRVLPLDVHLCGLADTVAASGPGRTRDMEATGRALVRRPHSRNSAFAKRILDIVVAACALILLAPVMAGVALAIKLDSRGPVLFVQNRHGYNNSVIRLYKFRSMYVDQADHGARKVVSRNDPRVTRIGRFIRRASIDELPQLFNVLRGEISLVGPRPHVVGAVFSERTPFEELVEDYAARHKVPPGITGWAQINGWRGEIDDPSRLQRRVEHDLYYIENRSFWMDLSILAKTIPSLIKSDYAY